MTDYMLPDVLLDQVGRFTSRTLIGAVRQLDVALISGFCGVCHSCLSVTFTIRFAMSRKGFAVRTSETARTDQRVNVLTFVPSLTMEMQAESNHRHQHRTGRRSLEEPYDVLLHAFHVFYENVTYHASDEHETLVAALHYVIVWHFAQV